MKIGLCGASGRIGWPLYNFLKAKRHKVLGTYCYNSRSNAIGNSLVKYDLREDTLDFFDKCDYVILASAYCNTPFCEQNKIEAYWLNVYRTEELLTHLSEKGIPTLFISSIAAKVNLDTTYGKYKRQVEKYMEENLVGVGYIRPGKTNQDNVQQLCEEIHVILKSGLRKKAKV